MNRNKCPQCGLVNLASDDRCRRCGNSLTEPSLTAEESAAAKPPAATEGGAEKVQKRSILRRLSWVGGMTLVLLFTFYMSLLLTSEDLQYDRRQTVKAAIAIVQQKGFARQAFVLNNLVKYRSTDNWLNAYAGHRDAYAATNFPFEVVTLYPDFFQLPVDDRERAAVLLHEACHLMGDGEDAALNSTWHAKSQLGGTADRYNQTRDWDATERLTRARL